MIHEKLTILLTSDIIDQETHDYVLSVLNYLLQNDIIEEEKKADVFLTHLAMADMRRKKSESINDLESFIRSEIEADAKFLHSKELWQDLQKMTSDKKFDDAELDYSYLHIINMLREE
jgi:phenylalanyl-tRNA synthetase alpha subunit